jgi:carbonic anhydrase
MGKCDYLILQCMDYRLQPLLFDWAKERGYLGNIDVISIGGSCKQKDVALVNIATCCDKHGVRRIFLTQHDDCAAYGGHAAFPSLAVERETLIEDMLDLREMILHRHAGVEVTPMYIEQDGENWTMVEVPLSA